MDPLVSHQQVSQNMFWGQRKFNLGFVSQFMILASCKQKLLGLWRVFLLKYICIVLIFSILNFRNIWICGVGGQGVLPVCLSVSAMTLSKSVIIIIQDSFFFFFFFFLSGLHLEYGLRVESELQLLGCTTDMATMDLSCDCNLYCSSWKCQILKPLSNARDRTCIPMDMSGS